MRRPTIARRAVAWSLQAALWACATVQAGEPGPSFNREVRPILSEHCFACHGPDERARKSGLRLDLAIDPTTDANAHAILAPGKPDESEFVRRITSADSNEVMPPPATGKPLSPAQIDVLRRWIAAGAPYEPHWAYQSPRRHAAPPVRDASWPRDSLDRFILARLEAEGLQPSPEAVPATLLRRVTLDLTGLPPTPAELDAFLADPSPDAYERAVDRLLASPRLGERLAIPWLDGARYADTNGYQVDNERFMWRWRDWVIDAFNANKPYDQFLVEQIAGDLLPEPTLDQKVATGFNRNHRLNWEGGIIAEEYAAEYVFDRVETTSTVFLGLTVGCARCHDHKYDPISQRDYYSLFAFFNNVPENGIDGQNGNAQPLMKAPTPEQAERLAALDRLVTEARARVDAFEPELKTAQAEWETQIDPATLDAVPTQALIAHLGFDGNLADRARPEASISAREGDPSFEPSPLGQAVSLDGTRFLDLGPTADFERTEAFTLAAWVKPGEGANGAVIAKMDDASAYRGYNLFDANGTIYAQIIHSHPGNALSVRTTKPAPRDRWIHLALTYDGSGKAAGVTIYVDGQPQPVAIDADSLTQTIRNSAPLQIGSRTPGSRYKGQVDDARVYARALAASEVQALASRPLLDAALARPADQRSPEQAQAITTHFREHHAPPTYREARVLLETRQNELKAFDATIPTTMIMQEMPAPRETHILIRGLYDKKGDKVEAATPASLPSPSADTPRNRLGLARWMTDPSHPLTARVAVNRIWQLVFGAGLVRTTENLGTQGDWPSHPELLDTLAAEFAADGWDVKPLLRRLVTSATYRQSSRLTPESAVRDPENRLLGRMSRVRLSAEVVRDQALAASGLMVHSIGGPSVRPYQPAGLWEELANGGPYSAQKYVQDSGDKLYRRTLYTFWKRTVPPPSLAAFDAPSRETCVVARSRTNTPLQALALLNETTYVEAARALAARMIRSHPSDASARLAFGFRALTAREPGTAELEALRAILDAALADFRGRPDAAKAALQVGESSVDPSLDPIELAAHAAVAGALLNLDETVTRE